MDDLEYYDMPPSPTPPPDPEPEPVPVPEAAKETSPPAPELSEEEVAEHKRKTGVQRLKEQRARLTAENEALQNQLRELQEAKAPAAPLTKPVIDDYETYESYTEALVDWKAEERHKAREAERAQQTELQTRKAAMEAWTAKESAVQSAHPDYDDVADIQALRSAGMISPLMAELLVNSEEGPEILYWLGSNPAEAQRIAGLVPAKAAMAMGKIAASFEATGKAPITQSKPTSKAPPPPSPIHARVAASKADDGRLESGY